MYHLQGEEIFVQLRWEFCTKIQFSLIVFNTKQTQQHRDAFHNIICYHLGAKTAHLWLNNINSLARIIELLTFLTKIY